MNQVTNSVTGTKSRRLVGGLIAAGLLGATALTGITGGTLPALRPCRDALAEPCPGQGFADLVDRSCRR